MSGQVNGKIGAAKFLMHGEDIWVTQVFTGPAYAINAFLAENQPKKDQFRNFRFEPFAIEAVPVSLNVAQGENNTLGILVTPQGPQQNRPVADQLVLVFEMKLEKETT